MEIKINILLDILEKKQTLLTQIFNITENQESILLSGQDTNEVNTFFNEMSHEKKKLIEEVIGMDDLFQNSFNNMKEEFEANAPKYKPAVVKLQNKIKYIMDIDLKIRTQEERNKMLNSKSKISHKISVPKTNKQSLLKQYAKNTRPFDE